jgi:serine/threonine-protein kinase
MTPTTPETIGRYQVVRALRGGGMGQVYLAQDPAIERLVAIKVLREGADNPEMRRRFTKEARSAGRLRHHHIVAIFDVGEHQGKPFIAMEFVQGETLEDLIHRHEPMSLERRLDLMDGLFAGLQYAHRNGIVHRDIKPANLMIDEDGVLKILDFGIARQGGTETQQNAVVGTLNYIAPEQLLSQPIDGRADMFSSGAVCYELFAGRQAFPGELPAVLTLILQKQPEPLDRLVPGLPVDVIGLINRCLAKDPNDRPADMGVLRRELAEIRRRIGADGAPAVLPPRPAEGQSGLTPVPKGRRDTTRQELLRIRNEQIDAHLADANAALAREAFQEALDACHRALVLDPENARVLAVEERAQAGLESLQLGAWLTEARGELERGSLTAAAVLVERALSVNPSAPDAVRLRAAIDEARRELAEAQARAKALDATLARGRQALAAGDLAGATAAVFEVLGKDAQHAGALALKRDVDQAVQARREADRARERIADARRRFAADDHQGAIRALEQPPSHPLIVDALGDLRRELQEIERVRKETALRIEEATMRFSRRDLKGASALVAEVLEREPRREDAQTLKTQIDSALAEERRIASALAEAKTFVGTGRFKAALDTLEVVSKADPSVAGLRELRQAAESGLASEKATQTRKQIDACLAAADRAVKAQEWAVALEQVQRALTLDPADPKARAMMEGVTRAMTAAVSRGDSTVISGKTVVIPAADPGRKPSKPAKTVVVTPTQAQGRGATVVVPPVADPGDVPLHRAPDPGSRTVVIAPARAVPAPAPQPRPVWLMPAAAVALVVIVAAVAWVAWPSGDPSTSTAPPSPASGVAPAPVAAPVDPAPATAAPLGTPVAVSLTIVPWALIESITTRDGRPALATPNVETPVVVTLPPGEYRVRAVNPNYRPLEFDLVVQPGAPNAIMQTMPDFRLEPEIDAVLSGRGAPR